MILAFVLAIGLSTPASASNSEDSNNLPDTKESIQEKEGLEIEEGTREKEPGKKKKENEQTENTIVQEKTEWVSIGVYEVSGYCPCVKCCGRWSKYHSSRQGTGYVQKTKKGTIPTAGRTVGVAGAVGRTLPLGTVIKINGNEYVVEDTGSCRKDRIDVYHDTHDEAIQWGLQRIEVYVKI